MLFSREPSIPNEKEETLVEDEDVKDEDIVERWKKGRFRPQVESRKPLRGFERSRQQYGRGRGRFGGSFHRSIAEDRAHERKVDQNRRERQRSGSEENRHSRLPGRFDRQRSRSDSRERQQHRGKDQETIKDRKDMNHKDVNESKSKHSQRRRSREGNVEAETLKDEGNRSLSSDTHMKSQNRRSEERKRDAPKRRWDQRTSNKEEGKELMKEVPDVKAKKAATGATEKRSQLENVVKEIRGRWERDESSDEENVGATEEASGSRMVDMFGRDISKRNEYQLKQKQIESRVSTLPISDDKLARYKRTDEIGIEKKDGLSLSEIPVADEITGGCADRNVETPKGEIDIRDDESRKPHGSSDDDDNDDDNEDYKASEMKVDLKKKRKKKDKKKKAKRSSNRERSNRSDILQQDEGIAGDLVMESSKDMEKKDSHYEKDAYRKNMLEGDEEMLNHSNEDSDVAREEIDKNEAVVLDGLNMESEMRERIKLKMRQRMEGTLMKRNILSQDMASDGNESDQENLGERVFEKGVNDSRITEKWQGSDGVERSFDTIRPREDIRITKSGKQIVERNLDSESGSEDDGKRKLDGVREKRKETKERHRRESEAAFKKERRRIEVSDNSGSSSEDKKEKERKGKEANLETGARYLKDRSKDSRSDSRKGNRKDYFGIEESRKREKGRLGERARHRHSDSSSETEEEKINDGKKVKSSAKQDTRSDSNSSSDDNKARKKKKSKSKRRNGSAESGKRETKYSKRRLRERSNSESSAERVERTAGARYKDRREAKSVDKYEAKSSQMSKGHTSRSGRDNSTEIKGKQRLDHSSEQSSTTDSEENIVTKGVLSKVYSKEAFSNEKEIHAQKHARKIDSTSSEESTSSSESDNKKHRRKGVSARGKNIKGRADRQRVSRRIDDGLSSEDESNEDLKRYAKGRNKAGHCEQERRNENEESNSSSSDEAEDSRKEKQRKRKSRKKREDSSSKDTRKGKSNKLKKSERQSKRSRENVSSTDHKRKEDKEVRRNRKKAQRESSVDEEQLKDKRRRKEIKHSASNDEYEVRKYEKKQQARSKSDKIRRRKKHSDTSSDGSEYEKKSLETRHKKYGRHVQENTRVIEKSGSVFETGFGEAKGGDSVGEQRSATGEEKKIEEEKGNIKDDLRAGDHTKEYDPVAREETYQRAILSILHDCKIASSVDMKVVGHMEEKPALGVNVAENLADDARKEAKIDRDSSSDISLYGDIDLKGVTSQNLLNNGDSSKTRQASPRQKILDRAAKRDEIDNTLKRKESPKPQYSRRTRSVSRDEDSRKKKQRRKTHSSDSGSSYNSSDKEDLSAYKRPSRTKNPKSHSRHNKKERSLSRDSRSLKKSHRRSGERSYTRKYKRRSSSESTSESDDDREYRKRSNRKNSRSRGKSPRQSTRSSSRSSVYEERGRNEAESKKRKRHVVDSKRRRRRSRTSSDDSRSSVSSIDRRKRRKK